MDIIVPLSYEVHQLLNRAFHSLETLVKLGSTNDLRLSSLIAFSNVF